MSSTSSARTLIRTGISLATRLVKSPAGTGSFCQQIASPTPLEIAPKLFPSLNNLYLPQNDSRSLKKLSCEPFLYPCGLPSLPFFLPDGNPLHLHLDVSLKLNCLLRRFSFANQILLFDYSFQLSQCIPVFFNLLLALFWQKIMLILIEWYS